MSVVLSAVFDDVDTADFAMADLTRGGVDVEAYRVKHVDGTDRGGTDILFGMPATAAAGFSGQTPNFTAGAPMVNLGGIAAMGIDAPNMRNDAHSREVIVLATIAENQASAAQSMLVSAGGRQVHPIG